MPCSICGWESGRQIGKVQHMQDHLGTVMYEDHSVNPEEPCKHGVPPYYACRECIREWDTEHGIPPQDLPDHRMRSSERIRDAADS